MTTSGTRLLPLYLRGRCRRCPRPPTPLSLPGRSTSSHHRPAAAGRGSGRLDQLEELAVDAAPMTTATRSTGGRTGVFAGEYDPHQIDGKGRYTRYIVRRITPDALMDRVETAETLPLEERLVEGAAVLAGTVLMAAGVSGWGTGAARLGDHVGRVAAANRPLSRRLL
ncbi:MAG: hypothetical protein U0736_18705 [Gemmataceae bacterium]